MVSSTAHYRKRAASLAYLGSICLTIPAIFFVAHLWQLGPGFPLMLFSMIFFAASFVSFWSFFYLSFTIFRFTQTNPKKEPRKP